MAGFNSGLNGILLVSREDFDSADMKRAEDVLYVVKEESAFSMYLGDIPLKSDGTGTPSAGEIIMHRYGVEGGSAGAIQIEED